MKSHQSKGAKPIPSTHQRWLRREIERQSERELAQSIGLSVATLGRCAGGLPVRRGSAALVELAFQGKE